MRLSLGVPLPKYVHLQLSKPQLQEDAVNGRQRVVQLDLTNGHETDVVAIYELKGFLAPAAKQAADPIVLFSQEASDGNQKVA